MINMTGQKIRSAFSKAANRYDELATLQQGVGLRFLDALEEKTPGAILDVGMGTGWFTDNLCLKFPSEKVIGIDFASGMVEHARQKKGAFKIVEARGEHLPFLDNYFGMVVSNLAYQWVEDLPLAFKEVHRALKKGGVFYLSAFGKKSLNELFTAVQKSGNDRAREFSPAKLPSKEDYTNALLNAGFKDFQVTSEDFKTYFSDALSLVRWLKDVGANAGGDGTIWGKNLFSRVDEYYRRHFSEKGKVVANFEVVWVRARKE